MPQSPDADLINEDLAPTPPSARTWTAWDLASLWIGMVVCVPTYMLAGGLVDLGMSWWQAVLTIGLGNVIVLVPMILDAQPGTRYGIPFPVLARASFGIRGASIPAVLRGLVACGWFGIQTWIGGNTIYQLLDLGASKRVDLPFLGINFAELLCFLAFWGIQVVILWKGMDSIKAFERWAAPFLIVMGAVLLYWAYSRAGGWGPMLSAPSQFGPGGAKEGQFWKVFAPAVTAMVGFWATLSLNIPDFSRFARSQRDQILGQSLGLPFFMMAFSFLGVAVTSTTVVIFGQPIADPIALLGKLEGGIAVVLALLALSVATLSTNLAANVVSPANAIVNLSPRRLTFRTGSMITAGLGLAIFPWKLIESTQGYIFTWLVGYSGLLGPIGGVILADYYWVRRMKLDIDGIYRHQGPYTYKNGYNPIAILCLILGILPNVPGFLHAAGFVKNVPPIFDTLYAYAFFVGMGVSFLLYGLLQKRPIAGA